MAATDYQYSDSPSGPRDVRPGGERFRDLTHPYGFAAFDVDPGNRPGGQTSIRVTYYTVAQPDGAVAPLESFTIHRRRSDG